MSTAIHTDKPSFDAPKLAISANIAPRINVAFHQNSVPAIGDIELVNSSDVAISEIELHISAIPEFLKPKIFRFDSLVAGGTRQVSPVPIQLDPAFLLKLTEAVQCELRMEARSGDQVLVCSTFPVTVLAPNEWTGLTTAPDLVAAFVRPNDPAVDVILRKAAEKLGKAGFDTALDGYSRGKKERVWQVANAIWSVLSDERIVYALPPQSFERNGQKVRVPSAILARKLGTCLDLTLLFAACLEQAGFNALVGFSEGHAFCGVWLKDDGFPSGVIDESQIVRKRLSMQDLILIETTLLTNTTHIRLVDAVAKAAAYVSETPEKPFELLVDIKRARQRSIRPLSLDGDNSPGVVSVDVPAGAESDLDEIPTFTEEFEVNDAPDAPGDRLDRWKRKLLDLSLRNKLLNFKAGKGSVTLIASDPGKIEDKLAGGRKLKIMPAPKLMTAGDPRNAEIHFRQAGEDAAKKHASEALSRDELHVELGEDELNDRLIGLFRAANSSFEEGGANSLHLAVGFVIWTPQRKEQRYKAPLLLLPVTLQRQTVRSGFRLVAHDDDARINPTLLEMLSQDFKLAMPEFERDLPVDESGLDIAKIWRIARAYLKDVQGFELTEDVVLSNFSFVKYLMWKDLVDRTDILKKNDVVRHLIDTPKEAFGDGSALPDERGLDAGTLPQDLFMPLSADSSQTAAVVAANRGRHFVLFGPPGTGKSQTIANMIVQLLGSGKTVLFVSQKTTALDVVRKRLNAVGLGNYCLEVHSAKAQKSEVLGQLKAAWDERTGASAREWAKATGDLKALRDRLNDLVSALHRRHGNGLTAHQAMGRVISGRDFAPGLRLPIAIREQHDEDGMDALREILRQLRTAADAVGDTEQHPLFGVGRRQWSPLWQRDFDETALSFASQSRAIGQTCAKLVSNLGLPTDGGPQQIVPLLNFLIATRRPEAPLASTFLERDSRPLRDAYLAWKTAKAKCDSIQSRLARSYSDGVFTQNLTGLLSEWREASNSVFFLRSGRIARVWEGLAPFSSDSTIPDDLGAELAALIDLAGAREKVTLFDPMLSGLGAVRAGLETNTDAVDALFTWENNARQLATVLANAATPAGIWLSGLAKVISERRQELLDGGAVQAILVALVRQYKTFDAARSKLVELADPVDGWLGLSPDDQWFEAAAAVAERWAGARNQTQRWCVCNNAIFEAASSGLEPLVMALRAGDIATDQLDTAFDVAYSRCWIDQIVDADPALRTFGVEQHEDAIQRFAAIDQQVAKLSQRVVASKLAGSVPPRSAFGADLEFGILNHEINKKRRHIPLRQLFGRMPSALTKLAPCMMMSPLSIAQFLPADAKPFDVVIFDEASQIPVWDAVGAIARGRQVIVAGDPKQLPPTSFFDRANDDFDDASDLEDLESILDECLGANIPFKRLAWHYRSRHESLIAFSNERYYDGDLVTFPSPVTEDKAVRYINVPGGVYERGAGRVNRAEARAVVAEISRRLTDPAFAARKSSIGVVTFNSEQQRLIENLLDQERRAKPQIERFFGAEWHEPVFVKNLEGVQGDERDLILFSVGYGPDQSGRVSQNFGPLNKDGGTRRLNVAITRARSELLVFATLRPDQIDLSRTKAIGVRDFKHFLEFAHRGNKALAQASAPLHRDADSPFERAVQAALEARGWIVHPQVGVSGFRIDLGVVHPDAPGRYIAGVECDGATYHRSATARDRDRLREQVLVELGWRIFRVWSPDWWVDSGRAMDRIDEQLRLALAEDSRQMVTVQTEEVAPEPIEPEVEATGPDAAPEVADEPFSTPSNDDVVYVEPAKLYAERAELPMVEPARVAPTIPTPAPILNAEATVYHVTDLVAEGFSPVRDTFYEIEYRPILRRMVARVIEREGPIFEDYLVSRIATAHGFGRAAGLIRSTVTGVIEQKFAQTTEDDDGEDRTMFWPEGADTSRLPAFRSGSLDDRDHSDIPLVELASLARRFLAQGATPEEAAALMAREFDLRKLRASTRERFERAAKLAQEVG